LGAKTALLAYAAKDPVESLRQAREPDAASGRRVILHAMQSVTDQFAYAIWEDGTMVRSL
jgi:hypothetical protein